MFLINDISNTSVAYLPAFRKRYYTVYWIIIIFVVSAIACLPFIYTNISFTAGGVTRPENERTEVKNIVSGVIESIYYKEGDTISKGALLLRIKDETSSSKRSLNNYEINQRESFIKDLRLLISKDLTRGLLDQLQTPLYKEQLNSYLTALEQQKADLRKAEKEYEINKKLLDGKVIAPKEFFDTQMAYEKAVAASKSLGISQKSSWQQDLIRYNHEASQYRQDLTQVNSDASYYDIKAPTSGTVQAINTLYPGGVLQAGQTICNISPNDSLLGECYVSTKDIGLVKLGQPVIFQIDAFDYNYFGTIEGKVISINNDYTLQQTGASPVFIVRCSFDDTKLKLKNGYQNSLKKGLTYQARFIVGKRSLWQLLWDKMDDWLNPNVPKSI